MPSVVFVIGLCGAGKSTFIEVLHREMGARVFRADDLGVNYDRLLFRHLRAGHDAIVEDVTLGTWNPMPELWGITRCRRQFLPKLSTIPDLIVHWHAFENDIRTANWNVSMRRSKRSAQAHIRINRMLTRRYSIPQFAWISDIRSTLKRGC